jgi:PhnB protein
MTTIATSIEPWLSIQGDTKAVDFYKSAFGATETYRMEDPGGGLVVKLAVDGASFWLSIEPAGEGKPGSSELGGGSVKMVITVADPDALFARALKAGAIEVFPIGEAYGWRLGRLHDPYGLHWEIGYQLNQ